MDRDLNRSEIQILKQFDRGLQFKVWPASGRSSNKHAGILSTKNQ
ncbi:hypothetical protein RBSH_01647 [Rhodopirellula baltica SH28]|uniref:Uncharacterized protein n=2 Tax=Rhodopirellula baltica TaxID=265606 RepID=F2B1Y4_RHOBT|nr:hypothetical protein RBWH47_00147 [Rhodopirellula baltica WH47]EKK02954.1 hypothetical protein RBSH_01647 [Rhodopirellula baltica SH28]